MGEVLRRSHETVDIVLDREYQELTVRLWGKGVVRRGTVTGAEVAASKRFVARSGQFILSRIDARNGAFGLVPNALDGSIVSNDFPVFAVDSALLSSQFLDWMSRTTSFVDMCAKASEGTTNRVRLSEKKFTSLEIPLPPLSDQERIVARLDDLKAQVDTIRTLRAHEEEEINNMLLGAFNAIAKNAPRRLLGDAAPLVRRPVAIKAAESYKELGIRSFGKGTFHKPALNGVEIGSKRIFRIEPGDLLFSNVFAWEGAIALAQPDDLGRVGSHRFITCVPRPDMAVARFLCFFFLTQEGLDLIGVASPGGAGRNRTLGLHALKKIQVPLPPLQKQKWFESLVVEVEKLRRLQAETAADIDRILPLAVKKAFDGGSVR